MPFLSEPYLDTVGIFLCSVLSLHYPDIFFETVFTSWNLDFPFLHIKGIGEIFFLFCFTFFLMFQ